MKEKLKSFVSYCFLKKHYFLSFLLPIGLVLACYAVIGVYPFGSHSVLVLDMNAQYVYYLEQFRDIITGNGSFLYTFERSMGGEFFGFYTYYLASPLNFLLILCPSAFLTEGIALLMALKSGFCGFTFFFYQMKTREQKNVLAFTAFSVLYALCSYATVYQTNTMWMDALIWLPLITLGIEKVVSENKFKFFIVSLAVAVWSNYYIGYMLCIFVFLYFFAYLFGMDKNPLEEKYHAVKSLIRIFVYSVVALCIAGLVIVTGYYSLTFGKIGNSTPDYAFTLRYDLLDLLSKMLFGSYDTIRPSGYANIYCGVCVLLLTPLYFFSKKYGIKEKIAYGCLLLVFLASFSINTIDLFWHGLQNPVWLNYRYSFLFIFVILVMASKGLETLFECDFKVVGFIGLIWLALIVVMQKTVTLPVKVDGEITQELNDFPMIWGSLVLVLLLTVVLYCYRKHQGNKVVSIVLLCVLSGEALLSAVYNWGKETEDVGWARRNEYASYVSGYEDAVDFVYDYDSGFYRFEKTSLRKPNDNFALDIRGLSCSTSTLHRGQITFLSQLGFCSKQHWSKYYTGTDLSDSILGVKYIISNPEKESGTLGVSDNYALIGNADTLGYNVYYNPYALSIAYAVENTISDFPLENELIHSAFTYQEDLLNAMLGTDDQTFFVACDYAFNFTATYNCNKKEMNEFTDFRRSNEEEKAKVAYTVTAVQDGAIYMHLPSPYSTEATLYVNGEKISTMFNNDHTRLFNLGNYSAGESILVEIEFDNYRLRLYTEDNYFVQVSETLLTTLQSMKEEEYKITSYTDTTFTGTLTAKSDKTVFTTLPYDSGWQVYVDGEKVQTRELVGSMLGFFISEGEHTVVMKYRPSEFFIGLGISVFGLCAFSALVFLERKKKKEKTK